MKGKELEHWRVEVSTFGDPILAIETGMYAGKPDLTSKRLMAKIPLSLGENERRE